jgi:Fe-S cluster biogenesis protein NfuA
LKLERGDRQEPGREFASSITDAYFQVSLKETMAQDTALQKKMQRIGEIVERLESAADPNARAMTRELVESLMALHGAGLERILELTAETGEIGEEIIRKCGRDELVSSLLLLYGLHPADLPSRVAYALEKARPFLQSHSASAELVSIDDDGKVSVRVHLKAGGCGSTAATLKSTLEAAIQDAAPDAPSIVVEGPAAALSQTGFVSLAQLQGSAAMSPLSGARAPGNGD